MVACKLAEGLGKKGWKVTWIASERCNAATESSGWIPQPVPSNNTVENRTGIPFPLWGLHAIRKLWTETAAADVVMVHESLYVPSMYAVMAAWLRRRPVLLVQHIGAVPYKQAFPRIVVNIGNRTWTRIVHLLSRRIVYISTRVMSYFEKDGIGKKSLLIPNGVDTDTFCERNLDHAHEKALRPVILFVGRFVEKKGLDIVELIARRRPDLDFVLAGHGPILPALWNLPNVEAIGRLDAGELVNQYHLASLLLLPSHGEGFPLVVQEAMATGLAPLVSDEIASALPGIEEHIYHAPVDRNFPDLIEIWSTLIDHALVAEQGGYRRNRRANFAQMQWNWSRCIDSYDQSLQQLYK